jgi:hypothetical protein
MYIFMAWSLINLRENFALHTCIIYSKVKKNMILPHLFIGDFFAVARCSNSGLKATSVS